MTKPDARVALKELVRKIELGDVDRCSCIGITSTLQPELPWDHTDKWLDLYDMGEIFVKTLSREDKAIGECRSLRLLFDTITLSGADISVPLPLGTISLHGVHWFFMERVSHGGYSNPYHFGRELGILHQYRGESQYGLHHNNAIGMGVQINTFTSSFITFFKQYRLTPQLGWARDSKLLPASLEKRIERLIDRLDQYLREPDFPSFLHGDLWGGNHLYPKTGGVTLIDPAPYWGDREADIGMTELFGGFSPGFYRGYQESFPLDSEYQHRKHVYNLYHALNHLNLFGQSYLSMVENLVDRVVG